MKIPIEFGERTHPFGGRERVAPRSRRGGRAHAGTPWEALRREEPEARAEPLRAEEQPLSPWEQPTRQQAEPCRAQPVPCTAQEPEAACDPPPVLSGEEETWRDRYLRLKADLENVRRHAEAERVRLAGQGKGAVLEDLFPIVDDLERAVRAAHEAGEASRILEGVRMVRAGLLRVLEKHGVQRIEAVGRPFDPTLHDAVAVREHPGHEKNTVLEELRNGFTRGDTLLRPASVIVAA